MGMYWKTEWVVPVIQQRKLGQILNRTISCLLPADYRIHMYLSLLLWYPCHDRSYRSNYILMFIWILWIMYYLLAPNGWIFYRGIIPSRSYFSEKYGITKLEMILRETLILKFIILIWIQLQLGQNKSQ